MNEISMRGTKVDFFVEIKFFEDVLEDFGLANGFKLDKNFVFRNRTYRLFNL
jgi:hypothetical protein